MRLIHQQAFDDLTCVQDYYLSACQGYTDTQMLSQPIMSGLTTAV